MHAVSPSLRTRCGVSTLLVLLLGAGFALLAPRAQAYDVSAPAILQMFEARWQTVEKRVPDMFMAGYGGIWLPPPGRADQGSFSVGYDVYDRFDLGYAGNPTLYGTRTGLTTAINHLQKSSVNVYVDLIWNHNGFSDHDTPGFVQAGGYPGFVMSHGSDPNGDFHPKGAGGDIQMRLSGLIDIAQQKNYQYIRSPVPGFANNLPAGTTPAFGRIANVPTENNRQFYTDLDLPGFTVSDPATGSTVTYYPFNKENPLAGDPVSENATGFLMRYTRWMVEVIGVDGFRVDAAKHMEPWVFNYYDQAVFRAIQKPLLDGSTKHVFAFSEVFDGNTGFVQQYIRKDITSNNTVGGNRDALDFALHFALRDNLTGNGFANNWHNIRNSTQDMQDDGFRNGSQGVAFDRSHDHGDGESAYLRHVANAYLMLRPGNAIVYLNAKEFGNGRSFPKNGNNDALGGFHGEALTTLVNIRNTHGRGDFHERWVDDAFNPNGFSNIYVYERSNSVLVGLNSRLDGGYDQRSGVQTDFAPGTRLIELTGNAADPLIDPSNDIPQVLIVDSNGRVNIRIPRNRTGSTEHGKGYVMYGLPTPQGELSLTNVSQVISGETPTASTNGTARLASIDVITADTFNVRLQTVPVIINDGTPGGYHDVNADGDNAMFRFNGGMDLNGNGVVDVVNPGSAAYGFEQFVTKRSPLWGGGDGEYIQTIDASELEEGMHYLTVRAFRRRTDGGPTVFEDFRKVIYVDRLPPDSAPVGYGPVGGPNDRRFFVESVDKTANNVHILLDRPAAMTDAQILASLGGSTQATQIDRDLWHRDYTSITTGNHVFTVVTFEITGNYNIQRFPGWYVQTIYGAGLGDMDRNNQYQPADIALFTNVLKSNNTQFNASGDVDGDGLIDLTDAFLLGPVLAAAGADNATTNAYNDMIYDPFVTTGTYNVNNHHEVFKVTAGTTNVLAGKTLVADSFDGGTLNIADDGRVVIRPDGTANGVVRLKDLVLAPDATLDLNDNDLIVDYTGASPYDALQALVLAGYSAVPDATKTGIISSTSQNLDGETILVLLDNAMVGGAITEWLGYPIDATTIIGTYTYFGDANLDGQVTGDDLALAVSNLGMTDAHWIFGDMNFDGQVTGDDIAFIVANMGKGAGNPAGAAIPEPTLVAPLLLLGVLLSRRRVKAAVTFRADREVHHA